MTEHRMALMDHIGLGIVAGVVIAAFIFPTPYAGYGLLLGAGLGALAYYYNPRRERPSYVNKVRPTPSNKEPITIDLIEDKK